MTTAVPDAAFIAALLTLPGMGPARLAAQLDGLSPEKAWLETTRGRGRTPDSGAGSTLAEKWRTASCDVDVAALWATYRSSGIGALAQNSAAYPAPLVDDPEPPAVVFTLGDPAAIGPMRAAIVGTRRCTRYGIDLAYELGALLATHDVTVVSGLAKGIDATAHAGALDAGGAPPVAVVGSGLDRPYPTQNRELWARVGDVGLSVVKHRWVRPRNAGASPLETGLSPDWPRS